MSQSVLINWKMVLDWIDSLFHFNDNWSLFIVRVVVGCLACSSFVVRGVVVVGVLHLHPRIGVGVVAVGRVFIGFDHIGCSVPCLSLFEDADDDGDEKEERSKN